MNSSLPKAGIFFLAGNSYPPLFPLCQSISAPNVGKTKQLTCRETFVSRSVCCGIALAYFIARNIEDFQGLLQKGKSEEPVALFNIRFL
jgi:hypothetical protein